MARKDENEEFTRQDQTGWYNFCACNTRYWARASDIRRGKQRRFVERESNEEHKCPMYPKVPVLAGGDDEEMTSD